MTAIVERQNGDDYILSSLKQAEKFLLLFWNTVNIAGKGTSFSIDTILEDKTISFRYRVLSSDHEKVIQCNIVCVTCNFY